MSAQICRRIEIMQKLLTLTQDMFQKDGDADYLIEAIDKRQTLIDAYDRQEKAPNAPPLTASELEEVRRLAGQVIKLDTQIAQTLEAHKNTAKADLATSNQQKKLLGYVNQAMSASGSYMDYKK